MIEPGVYAKERLDIQKLLGELLSRLPSDVGAVATFIGVAKSHSDLYKEVSALEVESYVEHATPTIQRICREVGEKHKASSVLIDHLYGRFNIGEPLVLVFVAGRSRSIVFPALEEAVERYKREPALFKKEVFTDGSSRWVAHA